MPVENELDIELPAIWIKQALSAPDPLWATSGGWRVDEFEQLQSSSAALVALFGKKFYSDVGVPAKPQFPYIVWDGRTDPRGCVTFNLPRDFTGQKRAIYRVRRVDNFESGQGSYNQARSTHKNLRRCLCGVGKTPIQVDGVALGSVEQVRWRDDYRFSYIDPETKALTVELGIEIEITYENSE